MRVVLLAAVAMAALTHAGSIAQTLGKSAGEVSFANSGSPAAQQAFQRGVALLHNFEYPRAAKAFAAAQKAEPQFALAYWGEAMTYNHPIWMEQDLEKGRAALSKLAPTAAERLAKARTPRERAYLEAIEALYGEGTKEDRDFAYSSAMEKLYRSNPTDVDAASFYALSLLGLAHKGRDYDLYMRAAGVLEGHYADNQRHPGVLHYLIHSYDDPIHAPLGLRAAHRYGAVAPDAPHALHMTSHIFLALGDWQNTIAANQAAWDALNQLRAADGKAPARCGHGIEWMHYAYYQAGQPERSDAIRSNCRGAATAEIDGRSKIEMYPQVGSFADMWLRNIVEQGPRAGEQAPAIDATLYPGAAFTFAYGDLLSARGKKTDLIAAHRRLRSAAAATAKGPMHAQAKKRQEIVLLQAAGLEQIAAGQRSEGLKSLRRAAELEKVMAPEFGPPAIEKPSFELLAEELLAAGRRDEAAEAFRQALKLAPGRRISATQLAKLETGRPDGTKTAAAAPHKH